jgi:hypothetical protein
MNNSSWLALTEEQKKNLMALKDQAVNIPQDVLAQAKPALSAPAPTPQAKPLNLKSVTVTQRGPLGDREKVTYGEHITPLLEQWGDATERANEVNRTGLDDLAQRLKKYEENQSPWAQANIAPLLAMVDPEAAAAYKAPKSAQEMQAEALGLHGELQKRRGDVAKTEADSLKDKIGLFLKDKDDPNSQMMQLLRYQLAVGNANTRTNNHGDNIGIQLMNNWRTDPTTKNSQEVATAFEKVQAAASDPSPAGDLSLIFGYMKMLDPGSVVREGEFATAQNAAGVPDRVLNLYNKLLKGERLNPQQRGDFTNQALNVYSAQMEQQERFNQSFEQLAAGYGLDPSKVVLRPTFFKPGQRPPTQKKQKGPAPKNTAPAATQSGMPKVGDVVDGMRFLGGDPANPKSWGM